MPGQESLRLAGKDEDTVSDQTGKAGRALWHSGQTM